MMYFFVCRSSQLQYRLNLYELRENRSIKPKAFMHMVSNLLYSKRYMYGHPEIQVQ